jgi:hypothetical protein
MSWMTKEGSLSALEQLLPRFWPSELSRRGVELGRRDADTAGRRCIVRDRGSSAVTTGRGATRSGEALGQPFGGRSVYCFEGFS